MENLRNRIQFKCRTLSKEIEQKNKPTVITKIKHFIRFDYFAFENLTANLEEAIELGFRVSEFSQRHIYVIFTTLFQNQFLKAQDYNR